jgi:hypothetical protein
LESVLSEDQQGDQEITIKQVECVNQDHVHWIDSGICVVELFGSALRVMNDIQFINLLQVEIYFRM